MSTPKTKELIRAEQQLLYTLQQIVESFPQYTVAQHMQHFLRKKNEAKEPYYWSTQLLLQKVEQYYDELRDMITSPDVDIDGDLIED